MRVLHDISLTLQFGRVMGLVGENGAGKSTLMNILGGVIPRDSGDILLEGKPYSPTSPADAQKRGVAFVHQELNLFTNLSIAENFFITSFPGYPLIDRKTLREKARPLLQTVDLSCTPDTPVERLSPAERQLVEIAKALSIDARLLILDEPTTSLTAPEKARLFDLIQRLRSQNMAIVYISHDLDDVFRLADEIVVLRDGEVVGSGPAPSFTVNRVVSSMVGRSIDQFYPARERQSSPEALLEVRHLSQPGIVSDIHFTLHRNEVLGIFGLMGSGRTELARILYGLDPFREGDVRLENRSLLPLSPRTCIQNRIAFLTEDRRQEGLLLEAGVAENLALPSLPRFAARFFQWIQEPRIRDTIRPIAQATRIQCVSLNRQPVKTLSGGNQQKVVLGKWLLLEPLVLILDEPTRGIDIGAKYEIYSLINELASRETGVLFISSEIEELMGLCDRILILNRGEIRGCVERSAFDREEILFRALQ